MKVKTKKIVAKRFKITKGGKKGGKVLRRRQNRGHLKSNKSRRQLARLKKVTTVDGAQAKVVKSFLGQ